MGRRRGKGGWLLLLLVAFLLLVIAYYGNPSAVFGSFLNWLKTASTSKAPQVAANVKSTKGLGSASGKVQVSHSTVKHPSARTSKASAAAQHQKVVVQQNAGQTPAEIANQVRADIAAQGKKAFGQFSGSGAGEFSVPGLPGVGVPVGAGG